MDTINCTVGIETEQEPISIESLWKLYTQAKIVPMLFKPTGETVYITPQVADCIEKVKVRYGDGKEQSS